MLRRERGADIARLLNFPEETADAITHLDEHWNGKGHPYGIEAEEIPLASRIMSIAQTVEVFHATFGLRHAVEVAEARCGTWFDPQLVEELRAIEDDAAFWNALNSGRLRDALVDCEPPDQVQIADEDDLDRIAPAFARVVDAKSPWTYRHSEGIAESLGMTNEQKRDVRRAGLYRFYGLLRGHA